MPDTQEDLDFSGVTLNFPGGDLAKAILPHVVRQLLSDGSFRRQLVQALYPDIQRQIAQDARNKGDAVPPWSP